MATSGTVRDINMNRIRAYMHSHGQVHIADAARETDMSIPTASSLIAELVERGEVLELGPSASTGGRCAMVYKINPAYLTYLLLRVGDGCLLYQVRDYAGNCLESDTFPTQKGPDRLVLDVQMRHPNLRGIYLGAVAHVMENRIIKESYLSHLQNMDVSEYSQRLCGLPAYVENDINLVTSGYWKRSGLQRGSAVCLHMTKYHQISAGLIVNGHVWKGKSGLSGAMHLLYAISEHQHVQYQKMSPSIQCMLAMSLYCATVDPERVVLYRHGDLASLNVAELRSLCAQQIPEQFLPQIEIANCWEEDYWLGLDLEMRNKLGISRA